MPTPIDVSAARDVTISWLSHAESVLVLEWAEEGRAQQAQLQAQSQDVKETQQRPATTADALLAEAVAAGLRYTGGASSSCSFSSSADDPDEERRTQGLVPLHCDHTPFPFHRSSGVVFALPPGSGGRASPAVSAAMPSDCGEWAPGVIDKVPVGADYYAALQKAWARTPEQPPRLPPLATESEVNLADIEEVLSGDSDYEELRPPVPLGLMISYFTVDWRDSGLYDVVQRREETLLQQSSKRGL
ncbi:hypothetical protein LSCM1_04222 [Leishmania martiniquensis]|uniref:Uncharacterized protein n=1 Tax=Leishmania martiniquensis TaxID=1580590 RepID=A0A836KHV0_9TRYP|nr:hypothetical protein LSCM1_04222 [Leishmania martiniquensis]